MVSIFSCVVIAIVVGLLGMFIDRRLVQRKQVRQDLEELRRQEVEDNTKQMLNDLDRAGKSRDIISDPPKPKLRLLQGGRR